MNVAPVTTLDSTNGTQHAEANAPSSKVLRLPESEPLRLACDQLLAPISIAYETYGTLNADKSNAILICHALTGDQYVARQHPVTGKPGWWSTLVGPGKPIDTDRFFVICPNILGGCMGSTGPASINPRTGKPYGLEFSRHHHRRHGQCAGAPASIISASTSCSASSAARWAACRCSSGPRAIRSACSRPCRSPRPPGTPRRTSPSTRSAGRP